MTVTPADCRQNITFYVAAGDLLNANDRNHWRVKARLSRALRDYARYVAGPTLRPVTVRQHVTVTFAFPDRRRRDIANLAPTVKAWIDGFTDAGIWMDDDDQWVLGPDLRLNPERSPLKAVQVTIALEDAPLLAGVS